MLKARISIVKVGIFLTYDYSLGTWKNSGTLEKELKIYSKIAKENNINFTIFSWGDSNDFEIFEKAKNEYLVDLVPIYKFIKYRKNKLYRFICSFLIIFKLRKIIKNLDLIQQHQLYGSWVTLFLSKIYKKPYYLRSGYDVYRFSIIEKKPMHKKVFNRYLTYIVLKFSNIYSVTNETEKDFLISSFKFEHSKLKVRPNWVENNLTKDVLERNSRSILSVGRLVSQKNFLLLIESLKNTKDFLTLDIVGDGPQFSLLKEAAQRKNVDLNIIKNVKNEDLLKLFNNYVFYISFSLYEGHPKTVLEAMSCGCIVFASDIPSHNELIENNFNGVILNFDKPDIIKKQQDLLKNKKNIQKISVAANNSVLERFSLSKVAELYAGDYTFLTI